MNKLIDYSESESDFLTENKNKKLNILNYNKLINKKIKKSIIKDISNNNNKPKTILKEQKNNTKKSNFDLVYESMIKDNINLLNDNNGSSNEDNNDIIELEKLSTNKYLNIISKDNITENFETDILNCNYKNRIKYGF